MAYEEEIEDSLAFLHLNLAPTPSSASFSINVGPVVFFSVLDHYVRRTEAQHRVIGALLGVRSEDGSEVEVRNCFPLSYTETEETVRDFRWNANSQQCVKRCKLTNID
jgi:translation initiation factor 3 subunit F